MDHHRTRVIRDVVEVCAIVLAGLWALYVFVFQNAVVPSFAAPTPTFDVQMRHVGNDGKFAVIRIIETMRNIGTVRVHFTGHALTVLGTRVEPASAVTAQPSRSSDLYEYTRFAHPQIVYERLFLTTLGDAKSKKDAFLEPGQEYSISREFYVPRGTFDRLEAWLVAAYTKDDRKTIPTTIERRPSGIVHFMPEPDNVIQFSDPVAQLDLKAE